MSDEPIDAVTGAFSYTGGAIARQLLNRGHTVRTLTGHPNRAGADKRIEPHPLSFDQPRELAASLAGVSTLYNTYWIRFSRGNNTFDQAVENSAILFRAARDAGVERIVHVSVTNPSIDSPFPYFRGKASIEEQLAEIHESWAVVRPTVIFGPGDILMNNIAWLLRRLPVFAIPGDGSYRLRPVHVDDVGRLCADLGAADTNEIIDSVGPETFTFDELVETIRQAVGARSKLVHAPARLAMLGASAAGVLVRDVILTDHEMGGMMAEVAFSSGPTTGRQRFGEWLASESSTLGRVYSSELARHFR